MFSFTYTDAKCLSKLITYNIEEIWEVEKAKMPPKYQSKKYSQESKSRQEIMREIEIEEGESKTESKLRQRVEKLGTIKAIELFVRSRYLHDWV